MNSASTLRPTAATGHWKMFSIRWLVPLVGIPLLCGIIYAGWMGYREALAKRELEVLLAPILAAGEPLGDAWLEQRFRQTTSDEGTAAWSRILLLSRSLGWGVQNELPIVGTGQYLQVLDPNAPWEDNQRVGDFLDEARPVIDLVHQAAQYPTPVWQPLNFDGVGTLLPELQESRSVARLLQLDFDHAVMNRDPERALRALQSLQTTAAAFDWEMFMVGELVHMALLGQHRQAIRRSLYADLWTAEQLVTLMSQLRQPQPVARKWKASLQTEQAMALATLRSASSPLSELALPASATAELQLFRFYEAAMAVAGDDQEQLSRGSQGLEKSLPLGDRQSVDHILVGFFAPALQAYAEAFNREERKRRLTLTALAIKRFQLAQQRWPSGLEELVEVGLTVDEWTLPGLGPLGYRVEDEGQTAYLWSWVDPRGTGDVASEVPRIADVEFNRIADDVAVIR
ncbi:MAG: hypothetical protein KDA45_04670 [Planctomycetales bacterium]|nr:hypothetical protein [Planctomycetales bacterium]